MTRGARENVYGRIRDLASRPLIPADDDRVIPPARGLALSQMIPGARHANIAGAGHISYAEQPAEFNRIVLEFLVGQRR